MSTQHWSKTLLTLTAALVLATACATSTPQPEPAMDSLVSAEWLAEHLDDPDLVVLDCTVVVTPQEDGTMLVESGRAAYESGHIPSAGFADLLGDLSDSDSPYQFTAPAPEQFAAVMGALGVGDDSRVVLYDANGTVWAARVWWMLRWVGFDNAALLDGGLPAWTADGRPLSTDPTDRPARQLTPAPRPQLFADQGEVRTAIDDDAVHLIDVLPAPHYRGEMTMYGRPGHIPGAANIPVFSLVDESGRYRPHDDLAELHDGDHSARFITYCGGGIAAASNAFVMTRLGFTDVAVYDGSLGEWTADADNPMEVETAP
jgi:thiosulfate/3-mercaptopyruvate sulfurtransferase